MTRLLLLCLFPLAACAKDACSDVDGTCVSLTVRGSGAVDGLDITLTGAATGRKIAPEYSEVAELPVTVALALDHAGAGALHIGLAAVRGGAIVGEGNADVSIAPGEHASATLELDSTRSDGGTSLFDLACPDMGERCGAVCCGANQICAQGQCEYATAKAVVYLCPDFNSGCQAADFMIGSMCAPIQSAKPGSCYTTSLVLQPDQTYSISVCTGCNMGCSTGTPFTTPAGSFQTETYPTGISFYCSTPCMPQDCP
jgi:hypothetical protein